jgi:hypothetical protein
MKNEKKRKGPENAVLERKSWRNETCAQKKKKSHEKMVPRKTSHMKKRTEEPAQTKRGSWPWADRIRRKT